MNCPACNSLIEPGSKFCAKCGTPISSKSILLQELKKEQPAMNGFVRFLGGLCVFISVAVILLFTVWAVQTYQSYETRYTDPPTQTSGFNLIGVSDNREEMTQIALIIFAVGFVLGVILMVLGEGLILIAQVREEHAKTLRLVNRIAVTLIDTNP